MKVDIVFLAKGREEFTSLAAQALVANTNWALVRRLIVYTDGTDPNESAGIVELFMAVIDLVDGWSLIADGVGGPVNAMADYLAGLEHPFGFIQPTAVWAKIDNDVIVPPGWLDAAVGVMEAHPLLDLLGIEPPASRTRAPWRSSAVAAPEISGPHVRSLLAYARGDALGDYSGYAKTDAIGGIGLFRSRAWTGRGEMTQHSTYGGFTDWQIRHKSLEIGWIVPTLKLFLLDRLPMDPYAELSKQYIAAGFQRAWTNYTPDVVEELAAWWLERQTSP